MERLKKFYKKIFTGQCFAIILTVISILTFVCGIFITRNVANRKIILSDYQIEEIGYSVSEWYYNDDEESLRSLYETYGGDITVEFLSPTKVEVDIVGYSTNVQIDFVGGKSAEVSYGTEMPIYILSIVIADILGFVVPVIILILAVKGVFYLILKIAEFFFGEY